MMSKVYLSGKIRGDTAYREKFAGAQKQLEAKGFVVLNPALLPAGLDEGDYMRIAQAMLDSADMMACLPDWRESKGAMVEHDLCRRIGKSCLSYQDLLTEGKN